MWVCGMKEKSGDHLECKCEFKSCFREAWSWVLGCAAENIRVKAWIKSQASNFCCQDGMEEFVWD